MKKIISISGSVGRITQPINGKHAKALTPKTFTVPADRDQCVFAINCYTSSC